MTLANENKGPASDEAQTARRWRVLNAYAAQFVAAQSDVPPFTPARLVALAEELARSSALRVADDREKTLLAIMIHNEAWRETVAAVPFERRLLLLPQCLRTRNACPAETDAYGLLCKECGRCPLGALQQEAVALGYATLIAEGTSTAIGLLKQGHLDAVIGASCLPALEQTFLRVAEDAVPALALPLLRNGCDATAVDLDMLRASIRLRSAASVRPVPTPDALRERVRTWFAPEFLRAAIGADHARHAVSLALNRLAGPGKRWRPMLTAATCDALRETDDQTESNLVSPIAIATECFHKASLIHDDIEDDDAFRYGEPTLHKTHGVPIALNVGDLLLGEGYRLLANAPVDADCRASMVAVAAEAHRRLCIGQGEELQWRRRPGMPGSAALIDLFALKTAPAFEVAILLGAMAGGADDTTCAALAACSRALGIAYQIGDDIQDAEQDLSTRNTESGRPSLMFALLSEQCALAAETPDLRPLFERHDIARMARALLADYRERALQALTPLRSVRLKTVLTRLTKRILCP